MHLWTRAAGAGTELGGSWRRPEEAEEVEAEVPVPHPPSIGWGRVAPSPFLAFQHSPFLTWVAEVGVLFITGCPLGTMWSQKAYWAQGAQIALKGLHWVWRTILHSAMPWAIPLRGQAQETRAHITLRWRASLPGGVLRDPSLGWQEHSLLVS